MRRLFALGPLVLVALLAVACGSAATAIPPTATAAPTATPAPVAAVASPGAGRGPATGSPGARPTQVTGMIQSITADQVTLADGQHFALTARTTYVRQVLIPTSDLATGMFIAITGKRQADNSVLTSMINIFNQTGVAGGQFPLPGGDLMTNATIDKIDGTMLTVSFPGGGALIKLAPDVKITRDQPATVADATIGSMATLFVLNGEAVSVRLR